MSEPLRMAVLISGSGRTLANLIARQAAGRLAGRVDLVIASRDDIRGVEIGRQAGIPTAIIPQGEATATCWSESIFNRCRSAGIDLVVMAGFLHLLVIPEDFVERVINIHPSLLPDFGGQGCYGMHVHRAVLAAGRRESGCTVHMMDQEYDHGRVLLQRRVPVLPDDTPETLAARVFAAELEALPEAIHRLAVARPAP